MWYAESLVVTLENLIDQLSIEDIHACIIREGTRKAKSNGDDAIVDSEKLLHTGENKCDSCKKKGHIKSQCWKLKTNQRAQNNCRNHKSNQKNHRGNPSLAFMADVNEEAESVLWYIDSGALYHSTGDKSLFVKGSIRESKMRHIKVADGTTVQANMTGTVEGLLTTRHGEFSVTLNNVLLVPDLNVNLISVSAIQENGYYVIFRRNNCEVVRESDGDCALKAPRQGRSYQVQCTPRGTAYSAHSMKPNTKSVWHNCLGHLASNVVELLESRKPIQVSDKGIVHETEKCAVCIAGKMTRRHFPSNENRSAKRKLDLVHSDLCGSMSTTSLGGAR